MKSQHSPAPWHTRKDTYWQNGEPPFFNVSIHTNDGERDQVALVSHETLEIAQANARLIAVAPEMLEALEQAEEWLSGWASAEPYIDDIQAAIAKAKGESPLTPTSELKNFEARR